MQPVGVEPVRRRQQCCDLLGQPCLDRLRAAGPGAVSARAASAAISRGAPTARARARRLRAGASRQGRPAPDRTRREPRPRRRAARPRSSSCSLDLDDALERKDAVQARLRGVDPRRQVAHGGQDGGEHRLVDLARPARRLHASPTAWRRSFRAKASRRRGCAPAPRRRPSRRAAATAAPGPWPLTDLSLPRPGIGAADAVAAGEAGHARQRHWPRVAKFSRMVARP